MSFILTKTWGPAGDLYRAVIGAFLWPVSAAGNVLRGQELPDLTQAPLVKDPTDLVALPVLLVPIWIAYRVMGKPLGGKVERRG